MDISGIMQVLAMNQRYGVLLLVHKDGGARLVFQGGRIVSGDSDSTRKLGRRLLDKRLVTEDQLIDALLKQGKYGWKENKPPLGTVLLESGVLKQSALEAVVREQLLDVAGAIMTWKMGAFFFEPSQPQARPLGMEQGVEAEFLMIEAARLRDEQRARETAPEPATSLPARPPVASARSETPAAALQPEAASQPGLAEVDRLTRKLAPEDKVLLTQRLLDEGWGPVPGSESPTEEGAALGGPTEETRHLDVTPDIVAPGRETETVTVPMPTVVLPEDVHSRDEAQSVSAEQKAAENARRLARIIVSDIALYEHKALELAVQSGDFEGTLAAHLTAGRKLLAKRVPAEVLAAHDFLGEALHDLLKTRPKATKPD